MIEIRLGEDYDKFTLKKLLNRIKDKASRELTYSIEAVDYRDVNIEDVNPYSSYKQFSEVYVSDLFIVVNFLSYVAYYQGERYSGESLDEIIYDMFKGRRGL